MARTFIDWLRTLGAPEDPVATDTSSEWSAMSLLKAIYGQIAGGGLQAGLVAALAGTSATSNAIATGAKTFTTQTAKAFSAGMWLNIASDADETNFLNGPVTSYNPATGALVMSIDNIGGSGTFGDWVISLSGTQGVTSTVAVGTVTTLAPGEDATVADVGTPGASILNFGIPEGVPGAYAPEGTPAAGNLAIFGTDPDTQLADGGLAPGDIVTASSTDTFTNKTFDANGTGNALSNVETADIATASKSGADATLITGTEGTSGNLAMWNADGDLVDGAVVAANVLVDGDIGTSVQGYDADTAKLDVEDQALTGGARVTSKSLGTITTGTVTPDPGDRPMQHYTNNGAHTLAPGTNRGAYYLDILNASSAGAITKSGWTKETGAAFTTTDTHKFRCYCSVGENGSSIFVEAFQ